MEVNSRINFSSQVKRIILDELFKGRCMFIDCNYKLERRTAQSFTGDFCHIIGARKNGPRYSDKYDKKFIGSHENCMLLCKNHAYFIDNEKLENGSLKYTADMLFEMKNKYIKQIDYLNTTFSYHNMFKDLQKLLNWINEETINKNSVIDDVLEMPIEISKKIDINELPARYIEFIRRVIRMHSEIDFLINSYDKKINQRINEIKKYYIDLDKTSGTESFSKLIRFIIQNRDDFFVAAAYFVSYLFIRCDVLERENIYAISTN